MSFFSVLLKTNLLPALPIKAKPEEATPTKRGDCTPGATSAPQQPRRPHQDRFHVDNRPWNHRQAFHHTTPLSHYDRKYQPQSSGDYNYDYGYDNSYQQY